MNFMGKERIFDDAIYRLVFNGRPISEYVTYYWFERIICPILRRIAGSVGQSGIGTKLVPQISTT